MSQISLIEKPPHEPTAQFFAGWLEYHAKARNGIPQTRKLKARERETLAALARDVLRRAQEAIE